MSASSNERITIDGGTSGGSSGFQSPFGGMASSSAVSAPTTAGAVRTTAIPTAGLAARARAIPGRVRETFEGFFGGAQEEDPRVEFLTDEQIRDLRFGRDMPMLSNEQVRDLRMGPRIMRGGLSAEQQADLRDLGTRGERARIFSPVEMAEPRRTFRTSPGEALPLAGPGVERIDQAPPIPPQRIAAGVGAAAAPVVEGAQFIDRATDPFRGVPESERPLGGPPPLFELAAPVPTGAPAAIASGLGRGRSAIAARTLPTSLRRDIGVMGTRGALELRLAEQIAQRSAPPAIRMRSAGMLPEELSRLAQVRRGGPGGRGQLVLADVARPIQRVRSIRPEQVMGPSIPGRAATSGSFGLRPGFVPLTDLGAFVQAGGPIQQPVLRDFAVQQPSVTAGTPDALQIQQLVQEAVGVQAGEGVGTRLDPALAERLVPGTAAVPRSRLGLTPAQRIMLRQDQRSIQRGVGQRPSFGNRLRPPPRAPPTRGPPRPPIPPLPPTFDARRRRRFDPETVRVLNQLFAANPEFPGAFTLDGRFQPRDPTTGRFVAGDTDG